MRKLPQPKIDFPSSLDLSISGIADQTTRNIYKSTLANGSAMETNYVGMAKFGLLYQFPQMSGREDSIVIDPLVKSQLVKLYTQYFVPEGKPARSIYDDIKVSAGGKCPLCGGIGHVRTLDHYLPKAIFPLFSVLPCNMVPSCRDCNTERESGFATSRGSQTLHLYFDDDKLFNEKWIYARVIPTQPPVIEYFVDTPASWDQDDASRVETHFLDYGLAYKFSVEAASDLSETILTRQTTMAQNTTAEFSAYLAEKGNNTALPINNWRRVMFSALAADVWFCSQTF